MPDSGRSKTGRTNEHTTYEPMMTDNSEPDIGGWGLVQHVSLMCACSRLQHHLGLRGAVVEVGTYMGSTLIPLVACKLPDELALAIDPFDDAESEGTVYEKGVRGRLEANLARKCPGRTHVDIWSASSDDISAPQLSARLDERRVRLFHVDGSRAARSVRHGLHLAESTLAPDGCVFLDDFLNEGWPSVSEGAFAHLLNGSRLVPFALVKSKLGLSFAPMRDALFHASRQAVAEMELVQRKEVSLLGHTISMGR